MRVEPTLPLCTRPLPSTHHPDVILPCYSPDPPTTTWCLVALMPPHPSFSRSPPHPTPALAGPRALVGGQAELDTGDFRPVGQVPAGLAVPGAHLRQRGHHATDAQRGAQVQGG
eukprot:363603-Chlamydomonas_euryale.AAC.8